jgi:hypothetical protein
VSPSDAESNPFYRRSLELLHEAQVPFLLGGAYAFCVYTGIARQTKDFDLFVEQKDFERALEVFRAAGFRAAKTFPHWLGKVLGEDDSIDIIHRAGNGLCPVDDLWFERAGTAEVFGRRTLLSSPEEMIWMKAYIMERERYDGADVAHLLLHCAEKIDWNHLLWRFGPDWLLLLSHLILFGFIYPTERTRVPRKLFHDLLGRLPNEERAPRDETPICRGTLLSRAQFLADVREGRFLDARLVDPRVEMDAEAIAQWTAAIDPSVEPHIVVPEN